MPTNLDGQLTPNQVVDRDRTLIAITTITVSFSVVIVVVVFFVYCWHFGIAIDFNRIFDILDQHN